MSVVCPHCAGEIPGGAKYCCQCGRIVADYQYCEECTEPIASAAKRCPCCGHKVPTEIDVRTRTFTKSITASRIEAFLGGSSLTALFHPPRFEVADGRIRMNKWSFLGLRAHQQEIRIDRVASVQYTKGIIWGGLLIETFGGATEDIRQKGFEQIEARDMAQALKDIIAA